MKRALIPSLLAGLLSVSSAHAAETRGYVFSKVPDINGILWKGKDLFVSLGLSSDTGNALNTHTKVIKLSPAGGKGCKSMDIAEVGVVWTTTSCVKLRKSGDNGYVIDIDSKFVFAEEKKGRLDSTDIEILKNYDFVRERRISIDFKYSGGSCSATVTSRSYKPLDGKKFVDSRTGPIGCTAGG